jgi:hypothetical protein
MEEENLAWGANTEKKQWLLTASSWVLRETNLCILHDISTALARGETIGYLDKAWKITDKD